MLTSCNATSLIIIILLSHTNDKVVANKLFFYRLCKRDKPHYSGLQIETKIFLTKKNASIHLFKLLRKHDFLHK